MTRQLYQLSLRDERDVVHARQSARSVAAALGFDHHDQIRIATAASEIARNAFRYARDGEVAFRVDLDHRLLRISVNDRGPGIPHLETVLGGSYRSSTGMGMGLIGTRRLMDDFHIESTALGTAVEFSKRLPPHTNAVSASSLDRIAAEIARQHPPNPVDELQVPNRGVVALYAELDERADYLRRASELKTSFLSNMSHEFRTPLNSMLALTRMLLDRMDGDLSAEQEQQVLFIQRSARELAEMVDDLLDLAKVEAGRLDVKPKSFHVGDLFGALRGMLKPLLAESALALVFDVPEDFPILFTDEQKVSQVLRNFISNAIKFTPRGEVRVSATLEGDEVCFAVADTGIGISETDQRLVFEEFSQVDSALQRRVKGTGLGLPLSRKLAELLGGSVHVSSKVGVGSTFSLRLPLAYGADDPVEKVAALELPANRKVVLIVEDNAETAFIYARYLQDGGFDSFVAASVDEARAFLARFRPAAIILDVHLGADTSWDFLASIRREYPGVPVLVMTVADEQHRAFGTGADAFLRKPFVPEQMQAEIVRLTSAEPRPRVLMIDDNEVARYLLRGHLDEARVEVHEARDGREGIERAAELEPALIFLDFFMPDLNGAEVLRHLRAQAATAETPIVLHSSKVLSDDETAFFEGRGITIFSKQALSEADASAAVQALLDRLLPARDEAVTHA